jgi:hypothetical protein
MAVPALGHVLKQEKESVPPLVQSTVGKQPLSDKNGHWVLHDLLFWNQSASLLAYSKGRRLVAADQIAWLRRIPNFKPCFRKGCLKMHNSVRINL